MSAGFVRFLTCSPFSRTFLIAALAICVPGIALAQDAFSDAEQHRATFLEVGSVSWLGKPAAGRESYQLPSRMPFDEATDGKWRPQQGLVMGKEERLTDRGLSRCGATWQTSCREASPADSGIVIFAW